MHHQPQEYALFPQDFRAGEASPEELSQHLELANWTIGALEQAIQVAGEKEESGLRNLQDATLGTRRNIIRRMDDERV